uniref:Echinoderm microtubule-associated protein-like 1 n=1 Tax=Cynoglossus semilaevis TaxID=244447 RepID=A0A3P8UQU3_CYNSE
MEGEAADVRGTRGEKRNERLCTREERKRRKTSEMMVDLKQCDPSSVPSASSDDHSSAASGLDMVDRLTYLEQRMQMQEDEIQLLKMALADVLKRLNISEEHQAAAAAAGRKVPAFKARPVSLTLPSRPTVVQQSSASLKKNSPLPSSVPVRNYSPTPSLSSVKSQPGSVKDSPCRSTKTRPTSAASMCKKEGKSKEAAASAGTRRVTHCKVTMQIYLSPHPKRTGSSEIAKSASEVPTNTVADNAQSKEGGRNEANKPPPSFTLNLQKTSSSHRTQQDKSSYKSPTKSPSQYFQICY